MSELQGGDEALVEAHLRGDRDAFRALYERYRQKAFASAYRIVGDVDEAADLVQEIFVRLHGELRAFQHRSKFSTWLYRVVVNHAINRATERERRARIRERIGREAARDPIRNRVRPSGFHDRVQRAVESLSPKLRGVVALRYLEGLSYGEIAEVLELSVGTVKSRLFLAHEMLRPLLAEAEREV